MHTDVFFHPYEEIIDGLAEQNYAIINGLFLPEILQGLKLRMTKLRAHDRFKRAGIGQLNTFTVERAIRSDKIHWIKNDTSHPLESSFLQKIGELSTYLNRTCYTGIQNWEFHYACFEKGCFYKRHLDQFKNDESRKFSVVTYLNKNWKPKDGGALVLYVQNQEIHILPEFGKTVIFKSDVLEHEVLPARRNRSSITGWLR